MNITITTRGGDTVAIDLASLLVDGHVLVPSTIAPITEAPSTITEATIAPEAPAKTPRKPRKSTATTTEADTDKAAKIPGRATQRVGEDAAKRTSDENKALFRKISAAKRAKDWTLATRLATDAGWDGEVASIARKREATEAAAK